jgi:glycosyltransferase involved in cell wall biosynthesis
VKVAIIANAASTHTQRWAGAMGERHHDVKVFSVRYEAIEGVTVVSMIDADIRPPSRLSIANGYLRLRRQLPRQLTHFAPDVVHAHYASTNGYIAALVDTRPTVLTVWGTDVVPKPGRHLTRTHRHRIRRAVRHADIVTSTSEFMADHVRDVADPKRIEIIPFGVDLAGFRPTAPPGNGTVLVAKSLERRYGVKYVIAAMERVVAAVPEARLVIAGDGSLRRQLEEFADERSVPVTFLGRVPHDDLPGEIAAADIVINPTIVDESFGVVVLEAQAMGRPVVATRVGAVPSVCVEGETAILVDPEDPEAMATAIVSVLRGERLTHARSVGPRFVEGRFDWANSVDAMESLYRELAS